MNPNYLEFLSLSQKIGDEFCRNYGLDQRSLSILAEVGVASELNQALTVSDVMKLSKYGSPSTIHKSLSLLKEVGLINHFFEGGNRRTKYLALGEISNNYYANLGELIIQLLTHK